MCLMIFEIPLLNRALYAYNRLRLKIVDLIAWLWSDFSLGQISFTGLHGSETFLGL